MKITLTTDEVYKAIQINDDLAQNNRGRFNDAVEESALKFGIDLDGLEKIAGGRALHVIGGEPKRPITQQALAKWIGDLASHGATWMDGFFAALTAIAEKDEDCS